MKGLKILCPHCDKVFTTNDEIYCTSCGHLYHLFCLRQWQSRTTNCPQCNEARPTYHRIFLKFDKTCEENNLHSMCERELNTAQQEYQCLKSEMSLQISKLKKAFDNDSSGAVVLEQRIRHLIGEMEIAITKNYQLQRNFQQMNLKSDHKNLQHICTEFFPLASSEECEDFKRAEPESPPQCNEESTDVAAQILIQIFPFKEVKYPLEDVIIAIGAKLDVCLTKEDIVFANITTHTYAFPNDVTIKVQFRTVDLKLKFLSNRAFLRNDPVLRRVKIKEYTDDRIHALFLYANKKLRGNVFNYITCRNNVIMAKTTPSDANWVDIQSTDQVDDLFNKFTISDTATSLYQGDDKIDASYYKIV